MAITYRLQKGSRLTVEEMDGNFQYVEDYLTGLTASYSNLVSVIAGITASEAMQDATVIAGLTASVNTLTTGLASATASIGTLETNLASATASIVDLQNALTQYAIYFIGGQDDTGFLNIVEKFNNSGINFEFIRNSIGLFNCPQFDKTKHFATYMNISEESIQQSVAFFDNGTDKYFITYSGGEANDYLFSLGGWVKFEINL